MGFFRGLINWLKGVLSPIWLLKENIRSLIAFEFFFRLLTFLVIFPIMTWAQRLWLIGNGTRVIAWYNAHSFLRNPITWIVLLFMILLLVSAAMFEQFAIYDTLHASRFGMRRTTRQIVSAGFGWHCQSPYDESIVIRREPGELKHLSSRRKRK